MGEAAPTRVRWNPLPMGVGNPVGGPSRARRRHGLDSPPFEAMLKSSRAQGRAAMATNYYGGDETNTQDGGGFGDFYGGGNNDQLTSDETGFHNMYGGEGNDVVG